MVKKAKKTELISCNNDETFLQTLKDMRDFLSKKRKLSELASLTGVSLRIVHSTFSAKSFEEITGNRLTVYQKAIEMTTEINSLPQKAIEAIEATKDKTP